MIAVRMNVTNHAAAIAHTGATYGPVDQCQRMSENKTANMIVL